MINSTTDDLKTQSLVDAMQPWQPVEQLRLKPTPQPSTISVKESHRLSISDADF